MKKILIRTLKILVVAYVVICLLLFVFQEKLIFLPQKLDKNFKFSFDQKFTEINIKATDGKLLNGVLFTSGSSKGLIFYLHGNAGSLSTWGEVAKRYTELKYDVFMLDYRGYGKSEGSIQGQKQFYDDIQMAYDEMKKRYKESSIVVLGYSIGTGPAAYLASTNHPRLLILQAPYYSLTDMMRHTYPIIPTFLLKYKFDTYRYIKECKMPIVIFHGNDDDVVDYNSSLKLKERLKRTDTLITINGQGHNGITDNSQYIDAIGKILHE
jgi:pimeloyl-ACP methyl ester carboxylesterase